MSHSSGTCASVNPSRSGSNRCSLVLEIDAIGATCIFGECVDSGDDGRIDRDFISYFVHACIHYMHIHSHVVTSHHVLILLLNAKNSANERSFICGVFAFRTISVSKSSFIHAHTLFPTISVSKSSFIHALRSIYSIVRV